MIVVSTGFQEPDKVVPEMAVHSVARKTFKLFIVHTIHDGGFYTLSTSLCSYNLERLLTLSLLPVNTM